MANLIALFKKYTALLDEVYKNAAKTAVLESDSTLVQQGANANEIIIPKLDMDGLGDYDRNSGYVSGDVTLTNETVKFNYERGRMFSVDNMDNEETAGVTFGKLAGEFIRTKVVPEIDAVRFAQYAGTSGITKVSAGVTYADGAAVIAALVTATSKMDDDEVPSENRHLFITPTLYNAAISIDTTKSKAILDSFASIIKVPQSRFYTAVELKDGKSSGETAGGYIKYATHYYEAASTDAGALEIVADTETPTASEIKLSSVTPCVDGYTPAEGDFVLTTAAKDINFMIIHKDALLQFTKHQDVKVITPEANQDADAYKFGYRVYGLNDVYENKVAGIYLSHKA